MSSISLRILIPAVTGLALLGTARAQQQQPQLPPPPQQQPQVQAQPQQNPVCARLEAQLQAFDRGGADAARAEQVRKYEDAEAKQQAEIERQESSARRLGCQQNSFFVLFSGQQAQCGPINNKIQQMKSNLEQIQTQLEQLRGQSEGDERASQRRPILVALAQNNCGAQYQQAVAATQPRNGGIFDSLFGSRPAPGQMAPDAQPGIGGFSPVPGGSYRTVCVRTCDGYYYPISYNATPAKFAEDEKACKQSCPATEANLYMFRNTGETIDQAVSTTGAPYTALPTAFRYRQTVDPNCSCRHQGESWSQALKNVEDTNVEQGDIVVNEQNARQLSQPRVDAKGRPIKLDPRSTARPDQKQPAAAPKPPAASASSASPSLTESPSAKGTPDKPDPNRKVRSVGPVFIAPKPPANN
jgi:uncharacterized protein DUF2865